MEFVSRRTNWRGSQRIINCPAEVSFLRFAARGTDYRVSRSLTSCETEVFCRFIYRSVASGVPEIPRTRIPSPCAPAKKTRSRSLAVFVFRSASVVQRFVLIPSNDRKISRRILRSRYENYQRVERRGMKCKEEKFLITFLNCLIIKFLIVAKLFDNVITITISITIYCRVFSIRRRMTLREKINRKFFAKSIAER